MSERLGTVAGHIERGRRRIASAGWEKRTAAPSTSIVPPIRPDRTGERGEQFVLPLPFQSNDAGDLAIGEVERHVLQLGADGEVPHGDARR